VTLTEELEAISASDHFSCLAKEIIEKHRTGNIERDFDLAKQAIAFIESHPKVDFGIPGSLTQFAEEYLGRGYERVLLESVRRSPNVITLSMLNRLINGVADVQGRRELMSVLGEVLNMPGISTSARESARHYLQRQSSWNSESAG
jgi:hypothetical protein